MKEKIYELTFDDEKNIISRVSPVDIPAVGTGTVFFNNEIENNIVFESDEKQVFYSIAMRPNTLIFRKNVSPIFGVTEPAQVFYSNETVEKIQQSYFKNNRNSETNLNHEEENTTGIYPFESWIVQNKELDKTKHLGLDVNVGDWVMGYKVESPEIWQKVKNKEIGGLSIEANLSFKESNFNFNTNMNKNEKNAESLWNILTSFFSNDKEEKFAAELPEVATGFFADSLEVGSLVTDKDGNPLANASFEVEGVKYETDADGKIMELATKEEEATEQEMATEPMPDLAKENEDLKAKVTELETELNKLKADKVKAETDLVKMAKEVMDAKKIPSVVEKKYSEMTNLEKVKFNREN
jgi:hypothetical protein